MHQSVPVKELPNGKWIYEDRGGTFSHQHPDKPLWCEKHRSVDEAWECYVRLERGEAPKSPDDT